MNLQTPVRLARALQTAAGRAHYRRALLTQTWSWLGRLPWEVRLHRKLAGRLRMRISARDQVISQSIFSTGEWEPLELGFIRQYVKPGMVVVDIGANIGAHTLTLADCVGPAGIVHAFEPTRVFETLRHNIKQNRFETRVRLNHCALGAKEGFARFMACKPGAELFTSRGVPLDADVATGEFIEFPVITLDEYAERQGITHIDFLKVDVEGSEDSVLEGCSRLLAGRVIDCIMFELNDICLANSGGSGAALIERVRCAGYHMRMLDEERQFQELPESVTGLAFNVIATRQPIRSATTLQEREHARM
jgi:FkbM family methyltransferase